MSFLLDPPALFVLGILLYFAGNKLKLERLARITIGAMIVLTFISFSLLLYSDVFRCVFPVICNGISGSEFMFHSNITGIYKNDVPLLLVIVSFVLYPVWIFLGYAVSIILTKRMRVSKEVCSYQNIKSRKKISQTAYSVVRYPDGQRNINDVDKAVRTAVDSLGGIKNFVKPGDKVMIKVNICGGVPELKATYTTKETAGCVVKMVRESGGEPFLCDADMVWTKFWPNARAEGWLEWAEKENVKLVNLSDTKIVRFDFGKDSMMPLERVSKEILDADVIISIPAMKTHMMTGVTLGMKNMYGTFPEIDKARYHMLGIDEVIYWVNHAFTPNLTIIDGSIGGETVGPLSCDSVDFRTIISSNNVVTADSIASQLMGFADPKEEIDHLKLAHDRGLGDASKKFDFNSLPYKHSSDGNWKLPDPEVSRFYVWGTHMLLKIPGWDTLFNIGSDFFLYDAARLPILKYFTPALLQMVNDIGKWSLEKKPDTPDKIKRKGTNVGIYSILVLISLYGFVSGGFLWKSSIDFSLGFLVAIILGALFSMRMKTKHLVATILSSIGVAYLVERFAVMAGMWRYIDNAAPSLFALFAIPIFVILILGSSYFLQRAFAYVKLKGKKLSLVPFALVLIAFIVFLQFEGYMSIISLNMSVIYAGFAVLGLLHNIRQPLEWNLSFAVVAVAFGGVMELLGSISGLWSYAFGEGMPVFLCLAWAINAWAACGISQIAGIDLRDGVDE
ncbi:MAG: DUF362 domain-containing protein [Candidatus Methanoperedens sp.]|nr:DUF362 domain-containing protein [Candidatus Methanoperedens sp.]